MPPARSSARPFGDLQSNNAETMGPAAGAYAFYDRWADVFDTLAEPTVASMTRGSSFI